MMIKKSSGNFLSLLFQSFGRQVGFEPTTHGTTIRYSNQLSYNRHVWCLKKTRQKYTFFGYVQHCRNFFSFVTPFVRNMRLICSVC